MHDRYHHIRDTKFVNYTGKVVMRLLVFLFHPVTAVVPGLTALTYRRKCIFKATYLPQLLLLLIFCLSSATVTRTLHAESNSGELKFHELEKGVYIRYGRHEVLTAGTVADIANHGFIVGESSVAIIDPGGTAEIARQTVNAIKKITSLPISHVIVSHVHPDHSLGLAAFATEDTVGKPVILGHSNLAVALEQNLEFFRQRFAFDNTADQLLALIEAGDIQPVDTERTFDLGNRKITVRSFARAHSDTDMTVYDHSTKILWAGDLLFVERTPSIDGSVLGWLEVLSQLDQIDISTVIPGHGPSGQYSEMIEPQVKYLEYVVRLTRDAIANQVSLNEFISDENIFLSNLRDHWKLFDEQHRLNLSRAYAELEWE